VANGYDGKLTREGMGEGPAFANELIVNVAPSTVEAGVGAGEGNRTSGTAWTSSVLRGNTEGIKMEENGYKTSYKKFMNPRK
jgi:hypothetical protein